MKVKTNCSIIDDNELLLKNVAKFWNNITPIWQNVWGKHIHHGFYEADETPAVAQEKLLDKLTQLLVIQPQAKILDVGCGMGSSSIYLAKKFHANVTGISISQTQIEMAKQQAREQAANVSFQLDDAHVLKNFKNDDFDLVWSLESCEQFYNKNLFLQQAQRVLKTNGQLMLATWCSDQEEYTGHVAKNYIKLCRAFDTPYMPTINQYQKLLIENNFAVEQIYDWSDFVKKSWGVGINNVKHYSLLKLLPHVGIKQLYFLSKLSLMRKFFEEGLIRYGVFVARKARIEDC